MLSTLVETSGVSGCQVLWLVHEGRSRFVIPYISSLRKKGISSDLLFQEHPREDLLQPLSLKNHRFIVFYSYEDFVYAKNAWSWENEESKPPPQITCPDDVKAYHLEHTTLCCIHNHSQDNDMHDDLMKLKGIKMFVNEDELIQFVTQQCHCEQQEHNSVHALPPPPPPPLPHVPLAARVVVIRHAQRLYIYLLI